MSETPYILPRPVNGSVGASSSPASIGTHYFQVGPVLDMPTTMTTTLPAAAVRTRKVAILGFGGTVKDCPWQDDSWELWAMNGFWRAAEPDFAINAPEERYSLWFDMHTVEYTRVYGKQAGFGDAQERWLEKEHPFPILMLDESAAFPCVKRYPIEEVVKFVGRDYFTSTVAYALALAMMQPDVAEIGLWGVDLVHDTEYGEQRPCAEYLIGKAEAMGLKVTIHEHSALLTQRFRYGYEASNPLVTELRTEIGKQVEGLLASIKRKEAEAAVAMEQAHTDDGAAQALRAVLRRLDIWERGGRV